MHDTTYTWKNGLPEAAPQPRAKVLRVDDVASLRALRAEDFLKSSVNRVAFF
jgi:hypothetical protein